MAWHEDRGDEILIKHSRIPVSSSIMSQLSSEFHKLFTTQKGLLRKRIELPNEDPVVFSMICESAHGSFIPQDHISLQTLATMADAIQRYKIPATSRVHHTAEFSFAVLPPIQLLKLLGVAKVLGSTKYKKLLEDVFLQHPLQFEALPIEPVAGGCDKNWAVLGMDSASTNMIRLAKPHSKFKATECGVPRTSGNHTVGFAGQGWNSSA
jgi:hypothetical protein